MSPEASTWYDRAVTLGSFLLGFLYYGVAFACLAAFASKKASEGGIADAIRSFARALLRRRTDLPERARAAAVWLGFAVFLGVFGLGRQLNLQAAITDRMQSQAIIDGWYEERSAVQAETIAVAIGAGLVVLLALGFLLRKRLVEAGVPLVGSAALAVLLAVRTVSHHGADAILGASVLGLKVAHALELGALAAIGLFALVVARGRAR
jgi:hypothetical protein